MPSSPSGRPDPFLLAARPIAHRGLHGGGRIENGRAAFEAAIAAGDGIELDVQASADAVPMVFHDPTLERLTLARGPVKNLTAAALAEIRLRDGEDRIEPLSGILDLIAGRVPLLIEVKARHGHARRLAAAVATAVRSYPGPVGIMSFNPEVPHWLARNAPHLLRGLVVSEQGKAGLRGGAERHLALLRARPDFLAYDVRDLPSPFAAAFRNRGKPVFTWTVRTAAERARAAAAADQIIHELSEGSHV
ncbi:glycerophosphodiester phosphodiesterase family protein [Sphingosinicella sp. BN140058]|uniref:glycerophosphodiester phosphodiesterase family protein n=1 Tax=Sphingosinicella sp. BN140058 TaxID=1892855 RepID=UPI0010102B13|nr:glycerophosphodiester phosphodiesterase family protein [Sphingosinicella sp. BN140058]QAY77181.1 glycerophosphodiester phosphodiesterase [Sphingosinicella sp. BN140058]